MLVIPADRSYITVEPGQTAESYTAGLRQKYITALVLAGAYVILYAAAWCVLILVKKAKRGSLAGCGGKPREDASGADGPTNTYTPPVNEDGQIVITMPKTLLGGKTVEELETEDKEQHQTAARLFQYTTSPPVASESKALTRRRGLWRTVLFGIVRL